MKKVFFAALLINLSAVLYAQDTVRVYGKVTDFASHQLDSVIVRLKDKKFKDIYTTQTDRNGNFSMYVLKGRYHCLYAINPKEYGISKLEYWAWNVPIYKDMEIDPQYDRMEIYGVNVFEPQVSPYETYMIYFRPMSLTESLRLTNEQNKKKFEQKASNNHDTIDIAPENITTSELTIKINDIDSRVLSIQKITEYARGAYLWGYLVQVKKASQEITAGGIDKITVILHSKEYDEFGKADYYYEKE